MMTLIVVVVNVGMMQMMMVMILNQTVESAHCRSSGPSNSNSQVARCSWRRRSLLLMGWKSGGGGRIQTESRFWWRN